MYIPKIKQVTGPKIAGFLKDKVTGLKFNGSFVKDFRTDPGNSFFLLFGKNEK